MRHLTRRLLAALCFTAAAAATTACTGPDYDELAIDCEGKCDGLSSIRALVADAKKLDLQDLAGIGAGYATEALNDALSSSQYGGLQLSPTELYAPASVAAGDLTLKNLDTLVSGLAARLGESALTTEVNAIRADYLQSSGKKAYAESAFRIRASLGHAWNVASRGFGEDATASATLGFAADADLEARIIAAHGNEYRALSSAPLAAIKTARGFVLPRSSEDLRAMAPGESFALAGRGRLGINLGAGVPILIANPASWLTYSLVITAGLRAQLEGEMDVQLVRLRGDEVVIDVGVQKSRLAQAYVALSDGWGVSGLVERRVNIGGAQVDLGRLVDKAVSSRINAKLSLIDASVSRTQTAMRMSVARLRFDLGGDDPTGAREQALAQALRGDVRLAQALAARGDAGVIADFDMVRSGASAISYAGVDVLGMKFYRERAASEGSATIQTPGGALALMWESLHRESGWFFTSHGFTRVGVAGLRFDAREPGVAKGETNLFLQTQEGDEHMERDKVIDQIDSIIVAMAGRDALAALERKGNQLERYIVERCPLPVDPPGGGQAPAFSESCNLNLIRNDAQVASLRAGALADFDAAITGLPTQAQDLLHGLGDLRLASQSIEDPRDLAAGPTASFVFDFRLDDTALRQVMRQEKQALTNAVVRLMEATQLDRVGASDAGAARAEIAERSRATARAMGDIFAKHADQYQRLLSIDGASLEGLGPIGANALELRFAVDSGNRPLYDRAVSSSVAQSRAQVVGALFDELRAKAKDMPSSGGSRAAHPEQIASYGLMSLAPVTSTEARVSFKTDNDSCFICPSRDRYDEAGFASLDRYAKGPMASPIAAGLFDIDAIIDAPR